MMVMKSVEKGGLFLFILNGILERFLDYNMQQWNFQTARIGRKENRPSETFWWRGIWMRWVAAFPYGIRERRFAARAVVSGKGREKRGLGVAFGLYIKKCMKILVVVH